MCDYSLEHYKSRSAVVGENLNLTKFPSGSKGFTSHDQGASLGPTAVCMIPGTTVVLQDIQKQCGVAVTETVEFVKIDGSLYKDGVRFANGKEILLQKFDRVTAKVMTIPNLSAKLGLDVIDPAQFAVEDGGSALVEPAHEFDFIEGDD